MDKELVNAAAQTFCLAPEIYKDAFKQAGADIPDEVIQAVQQDPKKGMEILQGDKKFLEGVVKVFADNQEAIMQYVQEKQAGASKMFNGGKLGYLARKYQIGGSFVKTFAKRKAEDFIESATNMANIAKPFLGYKKTTTPLSEIPDEDYSYSITDRRTDGIGHRVETLKRPGDDVTLETYRYRTPEGDYRTDSTFTDNRYLQGYKKTPYGISVVNHNTGEEIPDTENGFRDIADWWNASKPRFEQMGGNINRPFGIKVKNTDAGAKRAARRNAISVPDAANAMNRRVGAAVDTSGYQYAYENATVGAPGRGTSTETYVTITPDKDTMINQRFPISSGDFVNKTYTNRDWQYDQIMDRMRSTGVFDALKEYKKGGSLKIK